ncbi:MAG: CRR6 family NdhI maturation factor [Elainellaceae cyanobacterium]
MTVTIALNADAIHQLDLSPAQAAIESWLTSGAIASRDQPVRFEIDYPREPTDPRELSEIPEIRLWFIRLDTVYPWLPYALDWEGGELGRYVAMLVPHQFSTTEGVQYNPEALEIFVMAKVFVLESWLQHQGIAGRNKIKLMTKTLGYEIDDAFFDLTGF